MKSSRSIRLPASHQCLGLLLTGAVLGVTPAATVVRAQEPSVSPALRQVYEQTRSARSVRDFDSVIAACERALDAPEKPGDAQYASQLMSWALNRRGEAAWDAGRRPAATRDFQAAFEADPARWRAAQNLAIAAAAAGELERAQRWMDRVLEIRPEYATAHFNRGELRFQQGALLDALSDYYASIELDAEQSDFHSGRAHTLFGLGRIEEALASYRRAIELAPEEAKKWTARADALQAAGRWREAADHYRRALRSPAGGRRSAADQRRPRINLAWLLVTCPDPAVRDPQTARALLDPPGAPEQRSVREAETRAALAAEQEQWAQAAAWLEQAIAAAESETVRKALHARLDLYRAGKHYRQPPPQSRMPPD